MAGERRLHVDAVDRLRANVERLGCPRPDKVFYSTKARAKRALRSVQSRKGSLRVAAGAVASISATAHKVDRMPMHPCSWSTAHSVPQDEVPLTVVLGFSLLRQAAQSTSRRRGTKMWLTKRELVKMHRQNLVANEMLIAEIDRLNNEALITDLGEICGRPAIETRRTARHAVIEWWNEFSYVLDLAATLAILRAGWRTGKALVP